MINGFCFHVVLSMLCAMSMVFFVAASPAFAAKSYTTQGSKNLPRGSGQVVPNSEKDVERCTRQDVASIKAFERVAKRKLQERQDLVDNRPVKYDEKELKKFTDAMDKNAAFFESDEYEAMRPLYKRCKRSMPDISEGTYFWLPE